ncbi:hypothetical protein AKJ09_07900 [Labilithrix luteola]|uniref:Thioredoxin domain-containing protein n=2 Tax=Labilithrix luteola TaxID=1391654 RepID=A0A0K1Q6H0_9BACT|nr:hypothetical protein AKJ09_07900 [Labilithrix luteola]
MAGVPALIGLLACNGTKPSITQDAPATAPVVSQARAAAVDGGHPEPIRVLVASEDTDLLSLIRTERLRARGEGRTLVVYAGASWCDPCRRFKEEVHSGRLDASLSRITLLVFDADRDTDRLASAGYGFRFIPFVALPGVDGHPLETEEARGKGSEAGLALVATLERWQNQSSRPR